MRRLSIVTAAVAGLLLLLPASVQAAKVSYTCSATVSMGCTIGIGGSAWGEGTGKTQSAATTAAINKTNKNIKNFSKQHRRQCWASSTPAVTCQTN